MKNPFILLGVPETADDEAIKKAYLQQVRQHPPEREPEQFQAIRLAFEAIKTRQDRLRYRLVPAGDPRNRGTGGNRLAGRNRQTSYGTAVSPSVDRKPGQARLATPLYRSFYHFRRWIPKPKSSC